MKICPRLISTQNRQLFRATSTVSKPAVVKFLYDIFVQQATPLKSVPGLIASFVYQPLTVAHLKASKATGGDAIDLDPADGPVMSTSQHALDLLRR